MRGICMADGQDIKKQKDNHAENMRLLLSGKQGLAKLFWYYWFPVTVILNIFNIMVSTGHLHILCGVFSAYVGIQTLKGTWNIIREGNKGWAIAVLLLVGLNLIFDVAGLAIDISNFLNR